MSDLLNVADDLDVLRFTDIIMDELDKRKIITDTGKQLYKEAESPDEKLTVLGLLSAPHKYLAAQLATILGFRIFLQCGFHIKVSIELKIKELFNPHETLQ